MPTYVYRCGKGHTFELFHAISDDKPKRCPQCRSVAKRVPAGGSGLLFKGSGFYITDYRSKGYKESAKQETGAGSGKAPEKSPTTPAAGAGTGDTSAAPPSGDSGSTSRGKADRGSHGSSQRASERSSTRAPRKPDR